MSLEISPHHRQSIRLQEYDYSQTGIYYVTVITYQKANRLGKVDGETIHLSQIGKIVEGEWRNLEKRFPNVGLDTFTVMPNHLHGIILLSSDRVRARREDSTQSDMTTLASPPEQYPITTDVRGEAKISTPNLRPASGLALTGSAAGSLGAIIGAFKSTSTRLINGINHTPGKPFWTRNYYEHIIRDQEDLDRIRIYIRDNLRRWTENKDKI